MKAFVSNASDPYGSRLAQLDQRAESLRARLLEIATERRQHALAAVDGDPKAIKRLAALDEEQLMASRELDLISSAQSELETKRHEQAQTKIQEERAKAEAEAVELTASIMAANSEVDRALKDLSKLLGQRHALLVALEKTKCRNVPNRLIGSKYAVTAACRAVGLQNHIEIGHVEPSHVVPLIASNKSFATIPAPAPKPAPKPIPAAASAAHPSRYIG